MAAAVEVATPAVVAVEAPATENDAVLKMRLGEGEQKAPKPRRRTHHPPYFEMIREAILAQAADGKQSGSSAHAIAKYMGEKHRDVLPAEYRKMLAVQLRTLVAKGRLVKVKASFKLAAAEAENKVAVAVKKAAPTKRRRTARAPGAKKPTAADKVAKKARSKRARKAAPAPAPWQPKQLPQPVRAAGTKKANKASA